MKYVMDTGVLSLFYAGDEQVKSFFGEIQSGRARGYVSSVNLAEFYYKICQKLGQETATVRFHQTQTILEAVETDGELTKAAGMNKCRYGHLSLADTFAAALTEKVGGTLLTTDEALLKVREIRVKHFKV
ncbi:MAG: type II toxin-antitoxin system VapC family toxin [Thaumarchaeota archaeon]|nr:type II toxin-antitoxin system VapC family toxin [Nitrososphaerota archaeon]